MKKIEISKHYCITTMYTLKMASTEFRPAWGLLRLVCPYLVKFLQIAYFWTWPFFEWAWPQFIVNIFSPVQKVEKLEYFNVRYPQPHRTVPERGGYCAPFGWGCVGLRRGGHLDMLCGPLHRPVCFSSGLYVEKLFLEMCMNIDISINKCAYVTLPRSR